MLHRNCVCNQHILFKNKNHTLIDDNFKRHIFKRQNFINITSYVKKIHISLTFTT